MVRLRPTEQPPVVFDDIVIGSGLSALGAVAGLEGFKSPIHVARLVMERTPHLMLAGEGAIAFAQDMRAEAIDDPAKWFTHGVRR